MESLNYQHLKYFWTVAKCGSVSEASRRLHLSQPTISAQIKTLEESLGRRLFDRVGRGIALTEEGLEVFRYAEVIFTMGQELTDSLRSENFRKVQVLNVGVADVVPKLIVHRILKPALAGPASMKINCFEGKTHELLARLAVHELDVVLTDSPVPPYVSVKAYSHELGRSGVSLYASPAIVTKLRRGFPQSINDAPMLLPAEGSISRRLLDQWFSQHGLHPHVIAEFADSALLKVFGQAGAGIFAAPSVIDPEITSQYGVNRLAALDGVFETFYAISVERKVRHPGVALITTNARERIFQTD
jgi:LysR family transcriptional activator of nhaA